MEEARAVSATRRLMSLNPFTNKRKKKEEEVQARYEEQQLQAMHELEQLNATPPPAISHAPDSLLNKLPQNEDKYAAENLDKFLPSGAQTDQNPPDAAAGWASRAGGTYEPPSRMRQCFSKLQSGFILGASIGGAAGFLYGTWAAIKHKHVLYLPAAIIQVGGLFGFFLACGTVIRCDELEPRPRPRTE